MKMVLAATSIDGDVYYVVDPIQPDSDGVLVSGDIVEQIPFWSYVTREPVEPVQWNLLTQELWKARFDSEDWSNIFFLHSRVMPKVLLDSVESELIDVPAASRRPPVVDEDLKRPPKRPARPTRKKSALSINLSSAFRSWTETKGLFKRRLRLEPYDPDARDGDGDGIVQEGTAWERPVGTRIIDGSGNEIKRGYISYNRSKSHRVVDENGKDVDYVPSYQRADVGTIGQIVGTIRQRGERRRLNVWIPDNPEFHGVQRETEPGVGNPVWIRMQEWASRFYKGRVGTILRGTPIAWDDPRIPETVYHVTPAFRQIMADGVIRAGGVGGLGGDQQDQIVSMTISREVAEQLLSDMRLMRAFGRAKTVDEKLEVMLADARKWGVTLSDEDINGVGGLRYYLNDLATSSTALNAYWYKRDSRGGPRNPVVFDLTGQVYGLSQLDEEDFGIVEIPRERLNNGAMITDFDLGQGFLEEVRSYGDVSIEPDDGDVSEVRQVEAPEYLSRPIGGIVEPDSLYEVIEDVANWEFQPRMDNYKHRVAYKRVFDSARWYLESLWRRDSEQRGEFSNRVFRALGLNVSDETDAQRALRQLFPSLPTQGPLDSDIADQTEELRQQVLQEAEDLLTEIYEDRPVQIAIGPENFFGWPPANGREGEGVIWDERYKSQFETGQSGGLLNNDWRAAYEHLHMGVDIYAPDEDRPIYGFIPNDRAQDPFSNLQNRNDSLIPNEEGVTEIYGGVVLVLRPGVKDRTTITFGDSLNNRSYPIPLNPELRRLHVEAIGDEIGPDDEFSAEDALIHGSADPLLGDLIGPRLVDRLIEERLSGSDGLSDVWTPGGEFRGGRFIEAQVHGGVGLSDVEEVILPLYTVSADGVSIPTTLEFMESGDPRAQRLIQMARKHGFKISVIDSELMSVNKTVLFDPKAEETAAAARTFTGSTPDPVPTVDIEAADGGPSVTEDAVDRPELEPPVKPRRPYTPAPPPFTGRASEIVDRSGQDFQTVLDGLDADGYWILDFETTGFDHGNMPVQVAMIRVENGKVVQRVNQFINPDRPLSDWSRQHLRDGDGNPLTEEWLAANGISVAEAQQLITGLVNGQIVVAHNAPFDLEVLERIVRDHNGTLELGGTVDTLALMRMAIPKGDGETGPQSHALGALATHLGYDLGDAAHDAMADVEATNEVLRRGLTSAVDNPRAETDVLDNDFMAEAYEEAQRKYDVDMAKYRDAMREYNRQVFEYQRALAQGKDVENEDVRVPYVPGTADSDRIEEQVKVARRATREQLANGIIDLLMSGPPGPESEAQWTELFDVLSQVETAEGPPWEVREGETLASARRRWVSGYVDALLSADDEAVQDIIDDALSTHVDTELAKQVYIAVAPSTASEIIRDKRIRSPFETPGVGQTLSLRDRATVEQDTMGVDRGIGDKQRPIYGFLSRSTFRVFGEEPDTDPNPTLDPSNYFGSALIRLKDDVRDRTTATFGDSMTGQPRVAVPLTVAGRDRLIKSMPDAADEVRINLLRAAVSPEFAEDAASLAARTWMSRLPDGLRKIISKRMAYRARAVGIGPQRTNFIEAQIHGGVSMGDIAEIVIPDEQGSLGDSAIEMLRRAKEAGITVRTTAGRVPVETDYGWQFVVPGSDELADQKSLSPIIEVKAVGRRAYLIVEPYDPDAKDGDGDGIVQEWTVWERPAGTRILGADGAEIARGQTVESTALTARPTGLSIVDADGNAVDYTPSYMPRVEEGTIGADVGRLTPEAAAPQPPPPPPTTGARGTPLADIGSQSLREQGVPTIRDAARPATPPVQQPAVTPPPRPAPTRSDPPVEERKSIWRRYLPGVWRRDLDEDYNDLRNEKLQNLEKELKNFIGIALRQLTLLGGASDQLSVLSGDETAINELINSIIEELGPFIRDEQAFREMMRRQLLVLYSDLPEDRSEGLTISVLRAFEKFQEDWEDLVTEELMSQLQPDMLDAIIEALVSANLAQGDGPIGVRINEGPLEQVLTSGRVKSQFETGTSEGAYLPDTRRRVEGRFMGIPEDLPDILRPIYGYIVRKKTKLKHTEDGELVEVPLDPSTWLDFKDKYVEGYGTYEIRVKPEVRERVTYTIGDSLGLEMTPIPFSEDSLREIARNLGMSPDDLDAVRRQLALTGASWVEPDTFHLALAGLLQRLPTDRRETLVKLLAKHNQFKTREMHAADYAEAQIHGGLDVEDIDRIIVPYESLDKVPEAIKRLAEIHGIPLELKEPSGEEPSGGAVEAPRTWTTTTPMF